MPSPLFGMPPLVVLPPLCPQHAPPLFITPAGVYATLALAVFGAYAQLPEVLLESGGDVTRLAQIIQLARPLCCHLGEPKLAELERAIPFLRALKN